MVGYMDRVVHCVVCIIILLLYTEHKASDGDVFLTTAWRVRRRGLEKTSENSDENKKNTDKIIQETLRNEVYAVDMFYILHYTI